MRQRFVVSLLLLWMCFSPFTLGCDDTRKPATSPIQGAWYKGDLHAHSTHSDGDSPVREVIATAESIGLDFFVLTDHDGDMGGSPSQWDDPEYRSSATILLYGAEWTTGLGHANVWALEPFDYTDLWIANRNRDARAAIDAAHDQGALFSISHPSAFLCCPWEYEDDEGVDAIEVWNATYLTPNFNYLSTSEFWEERLLAGRRVTGLGGSDTHELKGFQSLFLRLAEPTTWVFAAERSPDALLEAIRKGRVSVSFEPSGPRLELQADLDRDGVFDVMMGDNVLLEEPMQILLRIRTTFQDAADAEGSVVDLPPSTIDDSARTNPFAAMSLLTGLLESGEYLVVLLKNGEIFGLWKIAGETTRIDCKERVASAERVYYRAELWSRPPQDPIQRGLRGFTVAVSNPIYFGYPE